MSNRAIPVLVVVAGLCVLLLTQPVSLAQDAHLQSDPDLFREDLVEFFADLERYSPTVLGELSNETQSLEMIRESVSRLSPEDLASLQKIFALVPDWRMVPEVMASSLPPDAREGLRPAAEHLTDQVIELRALRAELENVWALARLLPPESLERLDLDQASVAETQKQLHRLTPQRLGMLAQRLGADGSWQTITAKVPSELPPEIRQGALALARTGNLETEQVEQVTRLRQELDTFLTDAERLPPAVLERLDLSGVTRLRERLESTTPEMMFVLRKEIDSDELRDSMRQVRMLADLESGGETERAELHAFRDTLQAVLSGQSDSVQTVPNLDVLGNWLSARSDAELALVRQRIEQVPDWRQTMPAVLEAAASPGAVWMVEMLRHGSVDSAVLEDLLGFREQLQNRFNDLQTNDLMDAERAAAALKGLEKTDLVRLAVMRDAYFRLAQDGTSPVPDGTLVDLQVAIELLAPEILVASGLMVPGDCTIPSIGSIGGGCIGIPGCDFCPEVCFPELSLPGLDLGIVCAAFAPLEGAIDATSVAINAIEDVIDGIFNTVTDLANTVAGLADPIVAEVIATLESIMDTLGLNDYLNPATLADLLGIAGSYWDAIPNVPTLPCPPDGTIIPLFGEVGESSTALSYSRYKWIFDKLIEMIPDVEEALPILIPAEVLYSGVEYLGICLESAAGLRDDIETADFRATVGDDLVSLANSLVALDSDAGALVGSINAFGGATSVAVAGLDSDIDAARATAAQIAAQIADLQAAQVGAVADMEELAVRSRIEANLVRGGDDQISTFQLPETFGGLLEVVRQIVSDSIQNALDAGFDVSRAQATLAQGDAAVTATDYKTAYESFRTAYRQATRGYEAPVLAQYVGDLDGNGLDELIVDFGPGPGLGLYIYYNSATWFKVHSRSPKTVYIADLDGNGLDEMIVDFGPGLGVYIYHNNTTWVRWHGLSPNAVYVGDLDGNGVDELIADFGSGPGLGVYIYVNGSSWTFLHAMSPTGVFVGDLDGNGLDELIIDFGPSGLWAYYNNSGWVNLLTVSAALLSRSDLDTASKTGMLQDALREALQNTEIGTAGPPNPYPGVSFEAMPPEPRPEESGLTSPPEPVPAASITQSLHTR